MAKTKAQVKAAPTPEKALSTIKDGRVTKAIQSAKSKTKEIAKAAVTKHGSKKPTVKDVSSEEEDSEDDDSSVDSGDGDSDDSDGSDSSDDSIGSAQKHVKSANGANGVNGIKATEDSDESDSTDSESDEEDIVAAKAVPPTNGVKKSVKSGANASEEDDSFHSADEKPEAEFEPDSDADSDSDVDDDSSSDGSDSDGEEQPKTIVAAPVKVNGNKSKEDSGDSDNTDNTDDDDEEEQPVPKKRKAEEEEAFVTKKPKVDSLDDAQEGPNGESTNLFVGRLSWATDDDALYQEFSPFGEIVGCRVVYDRDSGRSKGFGYVQFAKLSEAISAKDTKHGALFDGRNINVDYSQPRNGKPKESPPDRAKRFGDVRGAPADTIFVGNLSFDATYDIVKETFAEYGEITRISIPTDRESGQMKGFGYVSFSSVDEAKGALEGLSGVEIAGRRVRLDYANARSGGDGPSRGGGGGFGGGGFNRGRDGGSRGFRGGRGRGRGGDGGFRGRPGSTNRGGFGDYTGKRMTF